MPNDSNDQGRKDNTGKDHKPGAARRDTHAPTGSVGRAPAGPTPGLGTRPGRQPSDQTLDRASQVSEEPQDTRIAFAETNDPEVNVHYGKAERMIGKDDPEHPDNAGEKAAGPRISQSEYAKTFRRAAQRDTALRQAPKRGLE